MSAKEDLIAAALSAADELSLFERLEPKWKAAVADVRETCAPAMVQPVGEVPMPEVAYPYTLEYGSTVADTKVSVQQLNYPFGVCGADYLWRNEDGISYVRQTPLYTAALRMEVK